MVNTDRAATKADVGDLAPLSDFSSLVITRYGAYDIYGDGYRLVEERFPKAKHVLLESSGHLP